MRFLGKMRDLGCFVWGLKVMVFASLKWKSLDFKPLAVLPCLCDFDVLNGNATSLFMPVVSSA